MDIVENSYWNVLKKNVCSNKVIFFSALITTVLCFGFTVTSFSIGIDDPMREYYLYSDGWGSMIQQGRLLHVIFNALTGLVDFIPFLNDFIGAALFMISSLLFAALFQYITQNRFSTLAISAFSCIYVSYSIITEKFIYNLDVVVTMLSYCLAALSLMYAYRFAEEKDKNGFYKSVALLAVAIGSYESFICLFVCSVFAIFILEILVNEEKLSFKEFIIRGLKYALILTVAAAIYYALVIVVQLITGQYGVFERNNAWSGVYDVWNNFKLIMKNLADGFGTFEYLPMLEFFIAAIVGIAFFAFFSIKKRTGVLFVSFLGLLVGNFPIHILSGYVMFRAAQTFCFFVAFVAMIIISCLEKVKVSKAVILKNALTACVVLLVTVQTADTNRWFYNDYNRYQKDAFVVNTLATRLVAECDVEKPVVFVNAPENGYLHNVEFPHQVNGLSSVYWGIDGFEGEAMYYVFKAYGYDFLVVPTKEQRDEAKELSKDMGAWPERNCILETDSFIIVNFDEIDDEIDLDE